MKGKSLLRFLLLAVLLNSHLAFASEEGATWKGTYYQAIPRTEKVSQQYCDQHTPGSFVHSVKEVLAHGITTDKGIRLDQASFHEEKKQGIYLISGDLRAHGKTGNSPWDDRIHYYFYKLTELGETKGVWSSSECKGLYTGRVIKT